MAKHSFGSFDLLDTLCCMSWHSVGCCANADALRKNAIKQIFFMCIYPAAGPCPIAGVMQCVAQSRRWKLRNGVDVTYVFGIDVG
jgi:hypothetical protein